MSSQQEINVWLINKKYPDKPIYCRVKPTADIYTVKLKMIPFFGKKIQPTVTDFKLVRKGDPEDDKDDTIDNNYFDEKYNSDEAYPLFKKIIDKKIYDYLSNTPRFYFRTIQLEIKVTIYGCENIPEKPKNVSIPLPFETLNLESLIILIEKEINRKIIQKHLNQNIFMAFQNTENLDPISEEEGMKKYQETGLILYLFPVKVNIINKINHDETLSIELLLKLNKPLINYLSESHFKKLKITSANVLFKINNNTISADVPIHQELIKQKTSPVIIEVHPENPNQIPILIPLQNGEKVTLNFQYDKKITKAKELIKSIKDYFNLIDQDVSLSLGDTQVKDETSIKSLSSQKLPLILKYDNSIDLKMTRKFIINGEESIKDITLDQPIKSVMREIANENGSHYSHVTLKLDKRPMIDKLKISYYFIPPNQTILVDVKEFEKFIYLEFSEKGNKKIKVGFDPEMKIKTIRNTAQFKEIKNKSQSDFIFIFKDEKLSEDLTFADYEFKGDETIEVSDMKCYVFAYKDDKKSIYGKKTYNDTLSEIQELFNLKANQFFIVKNKDLITDKNPFSKYPNGTVFEVKQINKMKFKVNDKTIITEPSNKVSYIINKYLDKNPSSPKNIWLLDEHENLISPDDYVFAVFKETNQYHLVKTQETKKYTFQTLNSKFITEELPPSIKIGDILPELNKKGKKIEGKYLYYLGRFADDNSTLSSLIGDKTNEDDPMVIENEFKELIEIQLHFLIGQDANKNFDGKFNFIKGTDVYNVHYFAAQLVEKDFESISLEANGEMLNDDDHLDENIEITVDLTQVIEVSDKNINDKLYETKKRIIENEKEDDINRTQKIVQKKKYVVSDDSTDESDLEDFEEDEDEDVFKKGNGTYRPSEDDPTNVYTFKFKKIGGDEFELDFDKDVTVKEIREKIAEIEETDSENITIFVGNQRLADFNKLTNLTVPEKVSYFSVKVIDLQNTVVCTRAKLK